MSAPDLHRIEDLPVSGEHYEMLTAHGFTPATIRASGVFTAADVEDLPDEAPGSWQLHLPGLIFPWTAPDGAAYPQFRPDHPPTDENGRSPKYLFPKGIAPGLGVVRAGESPGRTLIVEGTKQGWVAGEYAPTGMAVYSVAGAQNWMSQGAPTGDLAVVADTEVTICLDADAEENYAVYRAGVELRKACLAYGASSVHFVQLPGGKKSGLDDVLAQGKPEQRPAMLSRLLASAIPDKPSPVKPRRNQRGGDDEEQDGSPYFSEGALYARSLARDILANHPAAITAEGALALYSGGVYHTDPQAFTSAVVEALGESYRPAHRTTAYEVAHSMLHRQGRYLPERFDSPMLNCRNGMVDLRDGTVHEHHPDYLSSVQIPVTYDPQAGCEHYEQWIAHHAPGQVEDLEEVASTMLDPCQTPPKAAFLFGPSRSGKSTFLRLMRAVAGSGNTSSVTLGALSEDRFAAANVSGAILNSAADLPASHVEDLSVFKMMTGEDSIVANRKYGAQFSFTNRALFVFSANELPTVSESSRAYVERIKPFKFPTSFVGSEDPDVEKDLLAELPGILVRWVRANRRLRSRKRYQQTAPSVREEFENQSDRVRQWVSECCVIWTTERLYQDQSGGRSEAAMSRLQVPPPPPGDAPGNRSETNDPPNGGGNGPPGVEVEGVAAVYGAYLPPQYVTSKRDLARAFNRWVETRQHGSKMGERKVINRLTSIEGVVEVRRKDTKARGLNITENDTDPWGNTPPPPPEAEQAEIQGDNPWRETYNGGSGVGDSSPPKAESFSEQTASGACREYPVAPARDTPLVLDLETASADQLHTADPGAFVRLVGYTDPAQPDRTRISEHPSKLVGTIESGTGPIVGHNILGFDLPALAVHHGLDLAALAETDRIRDTRLLAQLDDPPWSGKFGRNRRGYYSLDSVAERMGLPGKSDDIADLAKLHGGFDAIPTDDARFREYLRGDVAASAALAEQLPVTDYARREHRAVARLTAASTVTGFRVDTTLLDQRLAEGREQRGQILARLHAEHGLPLTDAKGREIKSPAATEAGKEAIRAAFAARGVELPRTAKSGAVDLSKSTLTELAERRPEVADLAGDVLALNGIRTVYGTVSEHLAGDRVHPAIWPGQSSGRWSVTSPGMTVFGKRDGKYREREIFLPEQGEVLLAADLDQVDMRAVAALSGDVAYQRLFEPGRDAHTEVAVSIFGDPARREDAKMISHAFNYGRSTNSLIERDGIDPEKAITFAREMREQFPGITAWQAAVREQAEQTEALDNGWGRIMRCDADSAYTQAPALVGQGCARDMLVEGILRLPAEIAAMIRTVVHDEVVFSVPAEHAAEIAEVIRESLTIEFRGVPVTAGVTGPAPNWGALYAK